MAKRSKRRLNARELNKLGKKPEEQRNWLNKEKKAKTYFLIGSDYIWPRTSNKIARKHIENVLHGTVVGEEYYPLGHTQFGSLINKIKLKKPTLPAASFRVRLTFSSAKYKGIGAICRPIRFGRGNTFELAVEFEDFWAKAGSK